MFVCDMLNAMPVIDEFAAWYHYHICEPIWLAELRAKGELP